MTRPNEKRLAVTALQSLIDAGWSLSAASDGAVIYKANGNSPEALLDQADGADMCFVSLDRQEDHCTLSFAWGLGEDLLADFSANTGEVLDEISDLIPI